MANGDNTAAGIQAAVEQTQENKDQLQETPQEGGLGIVDPAKARQLAEAGVITQETLQKILPAQPATDAEELDGAAQITEAAENVAAAGVLASDVDEETEAAAEQEAPDSAAEFVNTIERAKETIDKAAEEGEAEAVKDAVKRARTADLLEERAANREQAAQQNNADMQARIDALNSKFEELETRKIDPNRLLNDMSTGGQILTIIASGLAGALGVASGQGGNVVMDQLQRSIKADIASQESNLSGERQTLSSQRSLLSDMKAVFQDDIQAQLATEATMLKAAQLRTQALASRTQNRQAQINAAKMISDLEGRKQQVMAQFAARRAPSASELAGKTTIKQLERVIRDPKKLQAIQARGIVNPSTGKLHFALDKESARKFRDSVSTTLKVKEGLGRILESVNIISRLNPVERARVSTELTALVGQLRVPLTGPGVLTEKEYERLLDTIGNPTSLTAIPAVERAKIQTLINKFDRDIEAEAKTIGAEGFSLRRGGNLKTLKKLK